MKCNVEFPKGEPMDDDHERKVMWEFAVAVRSKMNDFNQLFDTEDVGKIVYFLKLFHEDTP